MIGVEIEGYYLNLRESQRLAVELTGRQGERDGSLQSTATLGADEDDDNDSCSDPDCDDEDCSRTRGNQSGTVSGWEFQTRAGSLGDTLRQLTQLYPDATSPACGMHVHVSFRHWSDATVLVSDEFLAYFRERMKAWGTARNIHRSSEFWKRLEGHNQYCQINRAVRPGAIASGNSDKYFQVNYSGFDQYKTIEFRLLPMFQLAKLGVSAIEEIVDIVENFLDRADQLGEIYSVVSDDDFVLDNAPIVEEQILELTDGVIADISESEITVMLDTLATPRPGHIAVLRCDALAAMQMALDALGNTVR